MQTKHIPMKRSAKFFIRCDYKANSAIQEQIKQLAALLHLDYTKEKRKSKKLAIF